VVIVFSGGTKEMIHSRSPPAPSEVKSLEDFIFRSLNCIEHFKEKVLNNFSLSNLTSFYMCLSTFSPSLPTVCAYSKEALLIMGTDCNLCLNTAVTPFDLSGPF
jgi:hypothetical protein